MIPSDAEPGLFAFSPLRDRFEPFGAPLKGRRRIQRMVDHQTERYVAIRRLGGPVEETRIRALLGLRSADLFPLTAALTDDQGPYLVGDFGDVTLAERLGKGPFSEGDLHGIAISVARGMKFLHDRGFHPVDPTPENLREAPDGSVRIAAITLGVSRPESEVPGGADPIQHDIRTFGRTLLALATGNPQADALDLSAAPRSLAATIEDCMRNRVPDATALLAALGVSHPASPTPRADADADGEMSMTVSDPSAMPDDDPARTGDASTVDPAGGATETGDPDDAPARPDPMPSRALSPDTADGSRADGPNAFPWRPVADLYRLAGDAKEGGMGSVRMAIENATRRKVAIKRILLHSGMRQSSLDRFYREAHSIANLSHPHVLQLLQPGRDEEGDYLVLEWAAGGSLKDQLVKDGKLPLEQVRDIARKIGSALAYAHKKGIVHRDIKPHNILLTETGEPKLADFGLARSVVDLTLSTSRGGAGSPLYMAPEQQESSHDADERSDLYSFGKTLYQLLTGKAPTNPDPKLLPPEMRRVILRCMEEDRALRPANADEFLKELEAGFHQKKPVLPWVIAAVALVAAVVAFQAGWIPGSSKGGAGEGGGPVVRNGGGNGTSIDPGPKTPVTPPGPSLAQASIAGIFTLLAGAQAGGAEAAPVPEDGTISDQVKIDVTVEGEDARIDPDKVRLFRRSSGGGESLVSDGVDVQAAEGGGVTILAPLAKGENAFRIDLGEQEGFAPGPALTTATVTRREPAVFVAEELRGGLVSAADSVRIRAEVPSDPISRLFLRGEGDADAIEVPVTAEKTVDFDLSLPATDGPVTLHWYWPDATPGSRLTDAESVRVVVDRTAPEVTLGTCRLNGDTLSVGGSVAESNWSGDRATVTVLRDDQPFDEFTLDLSGGGAFDGQRTLPAGLDGAESTLSVSVAYSDAAGWRGTSGTSITVDRMGPSIVGTPQVTAAGKEARVRFEASEALRSAKVNKIDVELDPDGKTVDVTVPIALDSTYELLLTDLAGNTWSKGISKILPGAGPNTPTIAAAAPVLSVTFESGAGGKAVAVVSADKPLASVTVNGTSAAPAGLSWKATLPHALADLRDPAWGPTHDPVEIVATSQDGATATGRFVCLPAQVFGRPKPPTGIPLTGGAEGSYCPHAATSSDHTATGRRPGIRPDEFVPANGFCGSCGWGNGR